MDINLTPARIFANNAAAQAIMAAHSIATGVRPAVVMNGVTHPARRHSYSESIDRARAERTKHYAGHAGEGGLQQHSVGGLYPWLVVAYGDSTFKVENVTTGQRIPHRFDDYDNAADWAERLRGGEDFGEVENYFLMLGAIAD